MLAMRMLLLMLSSAFPLSANPFHEAEQSFLAKLNSMPGIELAGGPFHAGEQHHFEGESGYFILAPALLIPTLDQRLSIQTKKIDLTPNTSRRTNTLPIATSPYLRNDFLTAGDLREIHTLLADHGFATRRDQITVLDANTIRLRPVTHLPILEISPPQHSAPSTQNSSQPLSLTTNHLSLTTLLGSQPWQGIPLYGATFDRTRGDFELETLRKSFIPKRRYEIPLRPPLLAPQTFFAEPGLTEGEWTKVLRNFAAIDLPAVEILEATLSEKMITLYADSERPILPQFWVRLEKKAPPKNQGTAILNRSEWQVAQAVEFRAEFPRPGPWWTFLPLLPSPTTPLRDFPNSEIPLATRREITTLVSRLRGIGQLTALTSTNSNKTIHARTTHDHWRGYDLQFTRLQNTWRLSSVTEWTQ